ncbi:retrovirus-related pol polyprotein from transposon RE1 [Citrus sinensis]|uniref:Retrovirus-related pol polyprotein from transposon RE1 n=1 Tax=Citrus sinensis TaxID=2711 RepID=A0ACB8IP07_CITSI|nr:retrovirus-related pol polyprotein from transposon RE1 [Citrus sinensis]
MTVSDSDDLPLQLRIAAVADLRNVTVLVCLTAISYCEFSQRGHVLEFQLTEEAIRSKIMNYRAVMTGSKESTTHTSGDPSFSLKVTQFKSQSANSTANTDSFASNLSLQLTVHKLNGSNYLEWAQFVKLVIDGRAIGKPHLFLPTAKDVWDAIQDMHPDVENFSQIFELKTKLWKSRQGDRDVTTYYNEIVTLWATDHMTGSSQLFSSYSPCAGNKKIKIADGSLSIIVGIGKNSSNPNFDDFDLPIASRKRVRSCTKYPMSNYVSYDKLSPNFLAFTSQLSSVEIPKNVHEALRVPEWRKAIEEEMRALEKNQIWEVTDLPKGKKTVGCKWVFTIKYNSNGTLERYKARLVAKRFTQTYDIDYLETFTPVAKLNTVRVLLSMAVNLDWPLQQLVVKNAFLNDDLVEEVYMDSPPGFEGKFQYRICKLKKSLYGLKQSPRAWFENFTRSVKGQGYAQAQSDHTMVFRHSKDGKIAVLIVYVDDIILTGDDLIEMERLKKSLAFSFEIKDLGTLRYFLGMEVARSRKGLVVSQPFLVSVMRQFMHSPYEGHLEAVYRILRYLKGTPGKGLCFKKGVQRTIEAYTDADWTGSVTDIRSTSAYCTFVWGNLVTWKSKKQSVVARSSAEAKYRAMAHGVCEMLWLKQVLDELRRPIEVPMRLYCDNKAAISIAHNPVHHDKIKHIEIDCHFIKEKLEGGIICMPFVPSAQQITNILTSKLGMMNI